MTALQRACRESENASYTSSVVRLISIGTTSATRATLTSDWSGTTTVHAATPFRTDHGGSLSRSNFQLNKKRAASSVTSNPAPASRLRNATFAAGAWRAEADEPVARQDQSSLGLALAVNVQFITVMATETPFIGRGR